MLSLRVEKSSLDDEAHRPMRVKKSMGNTFSTTRMVSHSESNRIDDRHPRVRRVDMRTQWSIDF